MMNLSEVFYEAACRMSNDKGAITEAGRFTPYSCHVVGIVSENSIFSKDGNVYASLMTFDANEVEAAANKLCWDVADFRTFMLLMASEAVK